MECYIKNDCLVLNQNVEAEIVVKTQSLIVDYSLQEGAQTGNDTNGTEWVLFVVEDTGTVSHLESYQVRNKTRVQTCHSENLEIFSDLLEPKLEEQPLDADHVKSTIPVFSLEHRHTLLKVEDKPLSVCSYRDILVILTEDDHRYNFRALRIQSKESGAEVNGQINGLSLNKTVKIREWGKSLLKIVTADVIEQEMDSHKTSDTLRIGNDLFKTLFGSYPALVNSPVLLFCHSDGSVYHISLSFIFSHAKDKHSLLERSISYKNTLWKILCETSSAVVNILPMTVPHATCTDDPCTDVENDTEVLMICCSNGTVITFHIDPSNPQQESVSQFVVRGPILGTGAFCNKFYHSTVSAIWETSLEIVNIGDRKPESQLNQTVQIKTTKARKQAMICHIRIEANKSFTSIRDSPCTLHSFLKDGTYKRLDSSALFDKHSDLADYSLQIKDVLKAIDKTGNEQQNLAQSIKTIDDKLEQVSIAAFLQNRELTKMKFTEDLEKMPFDCKFRTVLDNRRTFCSQGHIDLECEINNQMPRNLNSDWSLEVSTSPIECNPGIQICHTSTVVPLVNGWKTRETVIVPIAVNFNQILSGCNMLVTMILDTRQYLFDSESSPCLSIIIYQERIDILHFLTSKEALNRGARTCNTQTNVVDQIESLAKQNPFADLLIFDTDKEDDACTAEINIKKPLQLFRQKNKVLKNNSLQEAKSVLNMLLEDSNLKPEEVMQNTCHVVTLTGKDLYLEVKDIQDTSTKTSTFEQQREITTAVLYIQSDLSTAAAVSLSVDRKLKDFAMTNTGFPVWMTAKELQILSKRIQTLEKHIQSLNNKDMAEEEMRKEIRKLYENLRSLGTFE